MIKYDKLVRDNIPEIIRMDGKECEITTADTVTKHCLLEKKLQEEVNEYLADNNIEELADIMEVLYGLADSLGYSEKELNEARIKKCNERGGFKKGIILKSVSKKD